MTDMNKTFENGKALVAFFVCGDPSLEATYGAVLAAVEKGVGIVELNIPFSDPTAGDPVIQKANIRALQAGMTTDRIFDFIAILRQRICVPIVLSGYANVVYSYGPERFLERCAQVGVDGLLVPDLPFEEHGEFLPACDKYGIALISMVAITSQQRITRIARAAKGFLYIMATPGTREQELQQIMEQVRAVSAIPCIICLNGTELGRYRAVAEKTDGVVMDTPFVSLMERYGADAPPHVAEFVAQTKNFLQGS